jgi:hypothetical protein
VWVVVSNGGGGSGHSRVGELRVLCPSGDVVGGGGRARAGVDPGAGAEVLAAAALDGGRAAPWVGTRNQCSPRHSFTRFAVLRFLH